MATGRTLDRWLRIHVDGVDLSGYHRSVGPLVWDYPVADLTVRSDEVRGGLPSQPNISVGPFNGVFDNTATSGLHAVLNAPGSAHTIMIPMGIRAAPAEGDPVFCAINQQLSYLSVFEGDGAVTASVPFGMYDVSSLGAYDKPWGVLLHENSAETAVNDQTGVDDNGASTAFGGYMMYHVFAGNGTVTITTQHASTNLDGSFANLGGCTTGSIDASAAPLYGIAYTTARTTTVNRYLRWQISLGTATTVTFALAFVRALRAY